MKSLHASRRAPIARGGCFLSNSSSLPRAVPATSPATYVPIASSSRHVATPGLPPRSTGSKQSSLFPVLQKFAPNLASILASAQTKEKRKARLAELSSSKDSSPVDVFRIALIHGRYFELAEPYRKLMGFLPPPQGDAIPFTLNEVRAAIQVLSRSNDEHQWSLLETMFDDLSRIYGVEPTIDDHRALLIFLANSSTPRAAFPRLESIPVHIPIDIADFNTVLRGLARLGDDEALRSAMEQLDGLDLQPDRQTYHLLLQGLFASQSRPPPAPSSPSSSPSSPSPSSFLVDEIEDILSQMSACSLPPTSSTFAIISEGYRSVQDGAHASASLDQLRATLASEQELAIARPADASELLAIVPWNALVGDAADRAGLEAALTEVETMRGAEMEPDEETISSVLRGVRSLRSYSEVVDLVRKVEDATDVEFHSQHWSDVISRVLYADGGLGDGLVVSEEAKVQALKVYDEAIGRGVLPDSQMVLPLLQALCLVPQGVEPNLGRSIDLYGDLLRAEANHAPFSLAIDPSQPPPPTSLDLSLPSSSSTLDSKPALGPSVEVYDVLLKGIAKSRLLKTHQQAWDLLLDMKARGVAFSAQATVAHIKTYMSFSRTHDYAFSVYERFYAVSPQALSTSEAAWISLIRAFMYSRFPKSIAPSPKYIFEMIKDMRRSGFDQANLVVSALLSYYGRVSYTGGPQALARDAEAGGGGNDEIMTKMKAYVTVVLAWCRIDPFIEHDVTLRNTFMHALSRTGGTAKAYGIWQEISESKDHSTAANNASINIWFDALGLHGAVWQTKYIWDWLRSGSFPLTLTNYHAYLTALLRQGNVTLALQLVRLTMKQRLGDPPAPAPTRETIQLLMDWQKMYGDEERERIRGVVRTEWPEWWPEMELVEGKDIGEIEMETVERGMVDLLEPEEEGEWAEEEGAFEDEEGASAEEPAEEAEDEDKRSRATS